MRGLAFAFVLLVAAPAGAVPTQIGFAGRLSTADGPVEGAVALHFRLYDGETMVWEKEASAQAEGGMVFLTLDGLDASVFTGAPLALELTVDGEALAPRLALVSVPYAIRAGSAERLGDLGPGDVAPAAHRHDGTYLPLGSSLSCSLKGNKVVGIDPATGNVSCASDSNSVYAADPTGGLALGAGNLFSITSGGVTNGRLAADAVDSTKVLDGSLTSADLGNNACGNAEMADDAIGLNEMASDAIGNAEMRDNAIGNAEMANDAIGNAEMADNAVGLTEIIGTEVKLYRQHSKCDSSGWATFGATCPSSHCATQPNGQMLFLDCETGGCSRLDRDTCNNPVGGYLIAP